MHLTTCHTTRLSKIPGTCHRLLDQKIYAPLMCVENPQLLACGISPCKISPCKNHSRWYEHVEYLTLKIIVGGWKFQSCNMLQLLKWCDPGLKYKRRITRTLASRTAFVLAPSGFHQDLFVVPWDLSFIVPSIAGQDICVNKIPRLSYRCDIGPKPTKAKGQKHPCTTWRR